MRSNKVLLEIMYQYHGLIESDKEKAKLELREDPGHLLSHVASLRRWVESMGHLHCPTSDEFLLMFLRAAKFDQFQAQKRLDNFCTIRGSERGFPELYHYPDVDDPSVKIFLGSMLQIPLGRTEAGELVILFRMGMWNPDEIPFKKLMSLIYMSLDMAQANPRSQVNGIHYFVDYKNCGRKFFETFGDPRLLKHLVRIWQEGNPQRIKGFIIQNEPVMFDTFFKIVYFFMHNKLRNRIFRVKNDIGKVFDKIPGLKALMPKEYGGTGKSIEEHNHEYEKVFREYFKHGSPWKDIKVDESKRPKDSLIHLIEYADYIDTGTQGTYTKFEDVF